MALITAAYDFPSSTQMDRYIKWAMEVTNTILQQTGIKEIRAYRNPLRTTPQVVAHYEFDVIESCVKFIQSHDYERIMAEGQALGIRNISVQVWDASPAMPEPLRPS